MKIKEIVREEVAGLVPDASLANKPLGAIVNTGIPSTLPSAKPSANLSAQIRTTNYTALNNPSNNTNPTDNKDEQSIVQNNQKTQTGNMPVNNMQGQDPNRMVTVKDPKNPGGPGITVKASDLQKMMTK